MEGTLKIGKRMFSENDIEYEIVEFLGSGGQGEVYMVESEGQYYALKWYFKHMASSAQKDNLDRLIDQGAPDESFLWPMDILDDGSTYGYVMPLRPERYKSIVDLMKRTAEPSFYHLCKAGFNLTLGYQKLHSRGYCYRDISFGNVFFDPENGDVLICDNDNVAVNGKQDTSVYGTQRFMAPEIVTGQAKPSTDTDLYSMAVLLFYMFMLHHPLEGKREASIKCMDVSAMNLLYGSNPVFIFDPEDKSNEALSGYHDNALAYWKVYPKFFKDLFVEAFTKGIKEPENRIVERQWQAAFLRLMDSILICEKCGVENFYDQEKADEAHQCWCCRADLKVPDRLRIGKNHILLKEHKKIRKYYVSGEYDLDTYFGHVEVNPNHPDLLGICNDTDTSWQYRKADGTKTQVPKGKKAPVVNGSEIDFGSVKGDFILAGNR